MDLFRNPSARSSLESVFIAKYRWLLGWALHFAQGDRAAAEDLVQDTLARVCMNPPELEQVTNVEALLYTYLKYVHLEHLRRAHRYPVEPLPLVEFDTLRLSLRENAAAEQVTVQNTLRRIVTYLTWRKESAKSASLLILRFFHGFYPDEIMCLARMKRKAVYKSLEEARAEAKLYVTDPGRLRVMQQGEPPEAMPVHQALEIESLTNELQRMIFSTCKTPCLAERDLLLSYESESGVPIARELLAHLVSCQRCLNLVSHKCRLDPPADRSSEPLGFERSLRRRAKNMTAPNDSGRQLQQTLRIARERAREIYEHYPRQLTVMVNGMTLASQQVSSSWMQQELKLATGLQPEIIEVFSEQGICLLTLHAESQPASPELQQQIALSHGRRIEAQLRVTSVGLYLKVAYYDAAPVSEADEERETSAADIVSTPPFVKLPTYSRFPWWTRLCDAISAVSLPHLAPGLISVFVMLAVLAVLGVGWLRETRSPKPEDLLRQAQAKEAGQREHAALGVICQTIEIRTAHRRLLRTIYRDAQNRRPRKPQTLSSEDAALQTKLLRAGIDWDEPLDEGNYQQWHDDQASVHDAVQTSGGAITLETTLADGEIARASLTLRAGDFHPLQRTVEFRDGERIEIVERNYRVLPWNRQTEPLFGPPLPGCHRAAQLISPFPLVDSAHNVPSPIGSSIFRRSPWCERNEFSRTSTKDLEGRKETWA